MCATFHYQFDLPLFCQLNLRDNFKIAKLELYSLKQNAAVSPNDFNHVAFPIPLTEWDSQMAPSVHDLGSQFLSQLPSKVDICVEWNVCIFFVLRLHGLLAH
jgi:hypothetical protein